MISGEQKEHIHKNEGNDVKVAVHCSNYFYIGIKSAIYFLYWQCGIYRSDDFKSGLSLYCKGSKMPFWSMTLAN